MDGAANAADNRGHNMMVISTKGVQQIAFTSDVNCIFYRVKFSGNWLSWQKVSTDVPTFYKDYSSVRGFLNAGGVTASNTNGYLITTGESKSIYVGDSGVFVVKRNSGDYYCVVAKSWGRVNIIYGDNLFSTSNVADKVIISATQMSLIITNNSIENTFQLSGFATYN